MFKSVHLQNFRSYNDATFKFGDSVNVVFGPNASGKTNLLEATLVLGRGRSYRNKLPDLTKRDKPWMRLDADTSQDRRTLKFKDAAEFVVDGSTYKRLPAARLLPVVLFEPNHLQLLSGEPSRRREWLDDLAKELQAGYKQTLASYQRALAQRNQLLKKPLPLVKQQIFAWDVRLSELAGNVVTARHRLIENINAKISDPYRHIAGSKQAVELKYLSAFPIKSYSSRMIIKLGSELESDLARGFTGVGPHREDFETYLNNRLINEAGSRGEIRSLLISLKMLEKDWLEIASSQKPLLLLDDVFSELDNQRRNALVDHLKGHQTIITTTDADLTRKYFKKSQLINLGST